MAKAPIKKVALKDDQELIDQIVEHRFEGKTLKEISYLPGMPSVRDMLRLERESAEFREALARARVHGTDQIAEECLTIADQAELDPADRRIRIETRLKLIGKWNPRAYGDKVTNELTGPDGQPLNTAPQVVIFQLPDNGREG